MLSATLITLFISGHVSTIFHVLLFEIKSYLYRYDQKHGLSADNLC